MHGNLLIANDFHSRYSDVYETLRMNPMPSPRNAAAPVLTPDARRLGTCARGWSGWVTGFAPDENHSIPWLELERRLLEMGFVEGARIELMHEGPIGRDPIAIRVDDTTVALRRRDADVILVSDKD
jgi:ferrous iron transport protein A